jgi:hypothetical protein
MQKEQVFSGKSQLQKNEAAVRGSYVELDGERFYRIENYNNMPPFFMSLVSDSDHWMFISSNGALSAGRKNPDNALFPYYTDDKITDSPEITGSKTILFINKENRTYLWEPFSVRYENQYSIKRNLYKNTYNNKLIYEEENTDLGITFSYGWFNSDKYGFVRRSRITGKSAEEIEVEVLDGIQNILPYGVTRVLQNEYSTLVDAYKKNELLLPAGLGIYYLSSIPTDKAEPSEGLKASTVWSTGFKSARRLLSSNQLDIFRKGKDITEETDIRALRGAYFVNSSFSLEKGGARQWYIIAEVNQDIAEIRALQELLSSGKDIGGLIEADISKGTENLVKTVASADGLQMTRDIQVCSRHFSNVLFNVMRGGIFDNNYSIDKKDLAAYVNSFSRKTAAKHASLFSGKEPAVEYHRLIREAENSGDKDLIRMCYEYMPLTFSRRHGDPSRPWNLFSIETRNEDGSKSLNYQGNWRDIFQNWEALSLSYPDFAESMICRFVNASTADGYNPYRVTRDGIDWEVIDPLDPWSNIGYWGDHQVIYLLKLLEISSRYNPGKLEDLLAKDIFVYANVPYRIKPYSSLLKDPQNTIDFDEELHELIKKRVDETGADGKLMWDRDGNVYKVSLTEKLLVSLLARFSNFIPEAGIWMNTQRPEWNDANNALVGSGVSMVTLYYMRRLVAFHLDMFSPDSFNSGTHNSSGSAASGDSHTRGSASSGDSHTRSFWPPASNGLNAKVPEIPGHIELSEEVAGLLNDTTEIFINNRKLLKGKISDKARKDILDLLGTAGSDYRERIYGKGFSGKKKDVAIHSVTSFFKLALDFIDHSIRANRRDDGLYHAYNLIKVRDNKEITIRYLYEMLEGQVAILSSGFLNGEQVTGLLDALRASKMYRKDQNSYTLYPDRQLPLFVEKNIIPAGLAGKSVLIRKLVADGDRTVIIKDIWGDLHFNGTFRNAAMLKSALDKLDPEYRELVERDRQLVLDIFEKVFDHQSFTGRSGTFYKYEGLGCIYWHMVSKLLLAVEENYQRAYCTKAHEKSYKGTTEKVYNETTEKEDYNAKVGKKYNNTKVEKKDSNTKTDEKTLKRLAAHFYEIQSGIGVKKPPALYGAFPTDPYSHTPGHAGAQQPGMTGQVKEDIITRLGELGVRINDGCISFMPLLLKKEEFLSAQGMFEYYNVRGELKKIVLQKGQLAFTMCQVPIIYNISAGDRISIVYTNEEQMEIGGSTLSRETSIMIFKRNSDIEKIIVEVEVEL